MYFGIDRKIIFYFLNMKKFDHKNKNNHKLKIIINLFLFLFKKYNNNTDIIG